MSNPILADTITVQVSQVGIQGPHQDVSQFLTSGQIDNFTLTSGEAAAIYYTKNNESGFLNSLSGLSTGYVQNISGNLSDRITSTGNNLSNQINLLTGATGHLSSNPSGFITGIYVGNTIFVDAVYGNDSTAVKYLQNRPYRTLTGAKNISTSGDTIIVFPGNYSGTDLAKNKVNWFFYNGAKINVSGDGPIGGRMYLFDDNNSGCSFDVRGALDAICVSTNDVDAGVLFQSNSGSHVNFDCFSLFGGTEGDVGYGSIFVDNGYLFLNANEIYSTAANGLRIDNGNVILKCNQISSQRGGAISHSNGNLTVDANIISGNSDGLTLGYSGMVYINSNIVVADGNAGLGADAVVTLGCDSFLNIKLIQSINPTAQGMGIVLQNGIGIGKTEVINSTVNTISNGINGNPISIADGNNSKLILSSCKLLSDTGRECIRATSNKTVRIYNGSIANTAPNNNINILGGPLIVGLDLS